MLKPTTQHIQGCLYGGALGDAFASAAEQGVAHPISTYQPSWLITDDTQLTLSTCEAILAHGAPDAAKIAAFMTRDYEQGMLSGLGSSTLGALRALSQGAHWALAGIQGERAAGNGAAMRIAPVALLLDLDDWSDKRCFDDIVHITHKNEEALAGARAMALGIQYMLAHSSPKLHELCEVVASSLFDSHTRDALMHLSTQSVSTYAEAVQYTGTSGFAAHSVPAAFAAACLAHSEGLEAVFLHIVSCGGDTDTIASMAGQLFGASAGIDALPASLDQIVDKARLDEIFVAFSLLNHAQH